MLGFPRKILSAFLGVSIGTAAPAFAGELTVGGGVGWTSSPYAGHDASLAPISLASYEGEYFYVEGTEAGVYLWNDDTHELSVGLSLSSLSFEARHTSDARLKRLNDRRATLNAELYYAFQGRYGEAALTFSQDILGKSDGFSVDAAFATLFTFGPVLLSPGAGVTWDNARTMDYYFGISSKESARSGLKAYKAQAGFSPYLSLDTRWSFAEKWSVVGGAKVQFLSSEATDSPMVKHRQIFSAAAGIAYTF